VLIPEEERTTLCVSTQVGCPLACSFCATGALGFARNLRAAEIVDQVSLMRAALPPERPLTNVVFMGMGEPLLNYDNVMRAAHILCEPAGMAISAKAISISTAGVVPMIRRFTEERRPFRLVVSLGAPTTEGRLALMPIERRWPLPELMQAVRAHAAATGERITLAYVAIGSGGMGDGNVSRTHARQLAELVAGLRVRISLIDVSDETGQYRPPGEDQLAEFRDELGAAGIPVVRRYSGGRDIGAACGTLSASQRGGELVALRR
jgi:23S rRNA (adenine2503-C2)-methyltransferase